MYKAAILAARTDSAGVNDLYGYNATHKYVRIYVSAKNRYTRH